MFFLLEDSVYACKLFFLNTYIPLLNVLVKYLFKPLEVQDITIQFRILLIRAGIFYPAIPENNNLVRNPQAI